MWRISYMCIGRAVQPSKLNRR
uniref:Uncharacterized protein n=1 Tax=Oryza punctata TaxID=4537 RepID=A0A0E0JT44_ORYPU